MKKLWNFLFSSKLSMLVVAVFIIVIGIATFIEEKYDTATGNLLIYNATWFELLMLVLIVFYLVNSYQKKLFRKEKIPQLIFHFSFIFIIIGGGITRNFGFEAIMHIVEKESTNTLYTLEPYFQIRAPNGKIEYTSPTPLHLSQIENNDFHLEFNLEGKLEIDYKDYIANSEKVEGQNNFISGDNDKNPDILIVTVTYQEKSHEAVLIYDKTMYTQKFKLYPFDNLQLEMVYGPKPIDMPFELQLDKFTLVKYPGTEIPSASESSVVLIDNRVNLKEKHLIYKNNVLDYDGYRFFQTSYDEDESGTILSVNYDYYGTRVTYFGYILMALGALLILFSRKTHFSQLNGKIKEVRNKRKALTLIAILLLGFNNVGFSQNQIQAPISEEHADAFGHLIVQTYDGRFSSVHSLATDVIHKISGKDNFTTATKGKMGAMQLFLDMHLDPEFWKNQRLIVVREEALRDIIGISGKYASFYDFDENGYYKLEELTQKAFQKKATEQSTLDREIIKVSERVQIFVMTVNGTALKLFPQQNSNNNKWVSWNDSIAFTPLTGELLSLNEELRLPEFTYSNIMRAYLISTLYAREANDYSIPSRMLRHIHNIQQQVTSKEILPSERKIALEVFYNKSKIFDYLKYVYGLLGLVLLTLTFIKDFKLEASNKLKITIKVGIGFFMLAFLVQTFGMGLRWYLGGHAPWSNGYEVILLVAWGAVIAGFSVINYSKITLASTALLASILLMVAGMSYYDPQLTNLNPVLKSYWLIIHVAIITIGYGFLALSFILGILIILIQLIKTKRKTELFSLVVEELTYINEKLVTIGLFLAAVGTYIGCVWANESWGTYWSWNAKQVWSLTIILAYGLVLHFKFIPKMKSHLTFNIGTVISFASIIMTFVGVNYYFTKGLHSYASDDPPAFPLWAWVVIITLILLITTAVVKEKARKKGVD
jgi:cytochrome c-type biogenesis protein CcsB